MASRRKIKFSLQYKITILIFTLLIVTLGTIVSYYMSMNWNSSINEMKNSGKKAAKTLGALWPVAITKDGVNWSIYENYMKQFVQIDRSIVLMAIVDGQGNIRASVINDQEIKKNFKSIKLTDDKLALAKNILDAKVDDALRIDGNIKIKEKAIGLAKLTIKFSKFAMYRSMNFMILNTILLALAILVVGWLGAWYLAKFITTNFNIIAAGMRKVAEGNLEVSVNVKANDEVGLLADDFNRMIVELKEKVRIKDAFETVADGLKDMDKLKLAYEMLTYQEMTDKITKGYYPVSQGDENPSIFIFVDLTSFSNFTYELISEELREIIKKFIEKVSSTVLEYQGAVFKVTEKFVLISFGYPFKHDDDLRRALIATIEIRKELVNLVKSKITLGYTVEDFGVNFVLAKGNVAQNFVDKKSVDTYASIIDYLNFASRYGEKKSYQTNVYATREVAAATSNLANYEKTDDINLNDGTITELYKLKGTKF
jgi:HAMP domain-containing protein